MAHRHDHNPWADRVVYVKLEALASCLYGGLLRDQATGLDIVMSPDRLLSTWILPRRMSSGSASSRRTLAATP